MIVKQQFVEVSGDSGSKVASLQLKLVSGKSWWTNKERKAMWLVPCDVTLMMWVAAETANVVQVIVDPL